MPGTLLAELPEDQASGTIADIYREIREFSGVPYVSSLQRYLATMPGVLQWAWGSLRPAMVSGLIPETGWRLADSVRLSPLPAVSDTDRTAWKLDIGGTATIAAIAENFVRVSPVNLMMGSCLRLLLTAAPPNGSGIGGAGIEQTWSPPAMLPPMPGNVDPAASSGRDRAYRTRRRGTVP